MNTTYRVAKLQPGDKEQFIEAFLSAFRNDPLIVHAFGHERSGDPATDRRIRAFLGFLFDKGMLLDEPLWGIYDGTTLLGGYIAEGTADQPSSGGWAKQLRLSWRMLALARHIPMQALRFLSDYSRMTRAVVPVLQHRYLTMIAVRREAQGCGLGKKLLLHVLRTAEEVGMGVALDTENPDNVPLYEHFGFKLIKEIRVDGVTVYCMFCDTSAVS
ncbi:GNAT family N-acetyltransferase [Paenibacillus sp. J5C_2022]|uniref:GNAT family N-acetyltransferase n=1 Tax=Paenibacillus sp. J5C2022 TaxID=2977129 RepID=UPI0021D2E037|nr:GNAT family N-acetyltransferase [Paenibacillus sp. J5C2022]MCU6710709.1 GNAT family N-acetyltransferase [Paenibacillus sp. J5C2022]